MSAISMFSDKTVCQDVLRGAKTGVLLGVCLSSLIFTNQVLFYGVKKINPMLGESCLRLNQNYYLPICKEGFMSHSTLSFIACLVGTTTICGAFVGAISGSARKILAKFY